MEILLKTFILSRASVINFNDLIKTIRKKKIKVATDVFPEEPVKKNDPIRKEKNILFSAHRAGALTEVFYEMGEIVFEDLLLLSKGLPPRLCRKAELETVKSLRSKPVTASYFQQTINPYLHVLRGDIPIGKSSS